jgi:hypothetical protein
MKILIADSERRYIDDLRWHERDIFDWTGLEEKQIKRALESGRTLFVAGTAYRKAESGDVAKPVIPFTVFLPPFTVPLWTTKH